MDYFNFNVTVVQLFTEIASTVNTTVNGIAINIVGRSAYFTGESVDEMHRIRIPNCSGIDFKNVIGII